MKDDTNLLEGSDTVQDVQVKASETVTEVTSIAEQEEKTGQKIEMPSPEELVARASSSVISNLQALKKIINAKVGKDKYVISRKGMNRLVEALFDLPQSGQRVMLQGNNERHAFFIGQNLIRGLFILMQNHVAEEIKKRKEKETQEQPKTETQGETNVTE